MRGAACHWTAGFLGCKPFRSSTLSRGRSQRWGVLAGLAWWLCSWRYFVYSASHCCMWIFHTTLSMPVGRIRSSLTPSIRTCFNNPHTTTAPKNHLTRNLVRPAYACWPRFLVAEKVKQLMIVLFFWGFFLFSLRMKTRTTYKYKCW